MTNKYAWSAIGIFVLLGYAGMFAASILQEAGKAAVLYNTIGFIGVGLIGIGVIIVPLIVFVVMPAIESRDRPDHKR